MKKKYQLSTIRISFLLFLMAISYGNTFGLTPTRVILACDSNPEYIHFWPVVAQAWQKIIGLRPTLALIAHEHIRVDESLGDVIRFAPIKGVSTVLYAQCIRLLLPAFFPNEVCIISDMDMIPLQKKYFIDSIQNIPNDHIAVYRSQSVLEFKQFPMCYVAAKGSLFQDIFNLDTIDDIPIIIKKWADLKRGWSTDQQILYSYLTTWNKFSSHCDLLNIKVHRIDRSNWHYNTKELARGAYTDCHCPRPYAKYKKSIDYIINQALAAEYKKNNQLLTG